MCLNFETNTYAHIHTHMQVKKLERQNQALLLRLSILDGDGSNATEQEVRPRVGTYGQQQHRDRRRMYGGAPGGMFARDENRDDDEVGGESTSDTLSGDGQMRGYGRGVGDASMPGRYGGGDERSGRNGAQDVRGRGRPWYGNTRYSDTSAQSRRPGQ
jgi:hypothetical protein